MPFVTAFYRALGTGMVISVDSPIDDKVRSAMESLIEDYEHVLSRFRNDSLIAAIGKAEHGGSSIFRIGARRCSICMMRYFPPLPARLIRASARI
mgnify:CR=1 FL=1